MRFKIILLSLLLAACDSISLPDPVSVLSPYKMDIRQGNFVTAEMREKIKLGMSKSQVKYVLGTPMVSDVFHANRWDYVYRLEQRAKLVDQQRLTLYFDNDNLIKIDDSDLTVKPEPVAVDAK
jgi:outer membrane protein assembly factor BamE